MCERVFEKNPCYLGHVPDQYKTEEMCNKAVSIAPYKLKSIPGDHFKASMKQGIEMCNGITCYRLCMMLFVPEHLKTEEMCNKEVCTDPYSLESVPDHFKTQEICNKSVRKKPYTLRYIPDYLKTQEMCYEAVIIDPCYIEFFL